MASTWIPVAKNILKDAGHFIRCVIWYIKNTKDYTKSAFQARSKTFKSFDDVNVSGKSFMILGASGTIGTAVASYLVKKDGVTVHVHFHDQAHGDSLLEKLKPITHANSKVVPHKVDMSLPGEVSTFIEDFINSKQELNINCLSMIPDDKLKDKAGTQVSFVVNTLSPYMIFTKLSEYMCSLPDSDFKRRVINLTCGCILTVNVHLNDIELKRMIFRPLLHFSHEKKQTTGIINYLSTKNPKLQYSNVIPGFVERSTQSADIPEPGNLVRKDMRTPEEGADTVLWLAISEECLKFKSGEIYLDRQLYKLSYFSIPSVIKSAAVVLYLKNLNALASRYPECGKGSAPPPTPKTDEKPQEPPAEHPPPAKDEKSKE